MVTKDEAGGPGQDCENKTQEAGQQAEAQAGTAAEVRAVLEGKSSTTDPVIGTPNEHAFEVAYTALLSNLRHAERHGVQVDWEPDLETLLEMEAFMNSAPSAPLEAVAMQLYRLGLYPTPRFAPAHRVALSLYCLTYRAWCLFHQAQLKAVEAKPTAWIVPIEDTTLELTDGPLALSELALRSRPR